MRVVLVAILLFGLASCGQPQPSDQLMRDPVDGVLTVSKHPGGVISSIWDRFMSLRDMRVSVHVAGACYSACTMALSEELPLNCSSWRAVYHFHGAAAVDRNGRVVEEIDDRGNTMWQVLPPLVQDALPPPEEWKSTLWNSLSARDLEDIQGASFRKCT